MKNMQFAILGLGRFGFSLVRELSRMGLGPGSGCRP